MSCGGEREAPAAALAARLTAATPSPLSARGHATATLLPDGKVLVAGGVDAGYLATAEVYDPARATWTATGAMATARAFHAATLLPNGKVLVAGGQGAGDVTLSSAELYDPATGTWSAAAPMGEARRQHSATVLPTGELLVAGGRDAAGQLASAERYDSDLDAWTATGGLAEARGEHAAALLPDGTVLVAGGEGDSGPIAGAERYDPALGTWTAAAPMAAARRQHTLTLLTTGQVLVAGGHDGGSALAGAELYDPGAGTWTSTGPLGGARGSHSATLLPSGKLLVAGGADATGALASVEVYDPAAGTWAAGGPMVTARQDHTATLLPSGKALLAGGSNSGGYLASAELHDLSAGSWAAAGGLGTARSRFTATLLPSGKVLVVAGCTSNCGSGTSLGTAELFDPVTRSWSPAGSIGARFDHSATLLPSGKVLVAGGTNGTASLASAELYDPETGSWSPTGELTHARNMHTATLLASGRVLVAGGQSGLATIPKAEVYDPDTGVWSPTGDLVKSRHYHTATLLPSGKVLAVGGRNVSAAQKSAELYDPVAGTWSLTAEPAAARAEHVAALLPSGKVLIAGGHTGAVVTSTAELYDPAAATWASAGALSVARRYLAATLLPSGRLLVAGGLTGGSAPSSRADVYDPETGAWTISAPLGAARQRHVAVALRTGEVLVAGGQAPITAIVAAETHDEGRGAQAAWTPALASTPASALAGETVTLGGLLFTGVSEGSGGGVQSSPASHPLVLVWRQGGSLTYAPTTAFGPTSATARLPSSLQGGWHWVRVVVNGVPSEGRPLLVPPLTISPVLPTAPPRGSRLLAATGGTGGGFLWALGTNASGGSIEPLTGAYAAGPVGSVTDVVTVTDSFGNFATRNVAVTPLPTILPVIAGQVPNGILPLNAIDGSGTGWTWSLVASPSGGSVDPSTGSYTAGPTAGVTDVVRVTDSLGNEATREVAVAEFAISPATVGLPPKATQAFASQGGSLAGHVWTLSTNASGGIIVPATGAYTAGATGDVTDVVRVVDSLGNVATATVAVSAAATISPASVTLPPKGSQVFAAMGGSSAGWTWAIPTNLSGGSIDPATGAYTAGATGSVVDVVQATDSLGNVATRDVSVTAAISVSPPSAVSLPRGPPLTFTASGGSGLGFTWSFATNASGGTIGASTGLYAAGPNGGVTDVIRVTDSLGNIATASITVSAGVTVAPAAATAVPKGPSQTFTATGGSGEGFTWSFATNASGGTIDPSTGTYAAGPTGSVTDVVRATDSLGNVGTATVAVSAGASISPASVTLPPRGSQTFTAAGGSGSGWTWSFATNASGGSIDAATGAYVAGATGGVTDVVQVTDSLGNVGTRNVTVSAGMSISGTASVPPRGSQTFTAAGGSGAGFIWSLSTNASGGTINAATGAYTAGPTPSVTDVVQVTDSLGNVGTRNVTVTAGVSIAPTNASLPPKGSRAFSASGGSGVGWSWSLATNASGGSVNASTGAYVAGPTGGVTDVVQVADSLGNVATRNVTVTAGVSIAGVASVPPRGGQTFTAAGGSGSGWSWTLVTNASGGSIDPATGAYTAGAIPSVTDVVQVTDLLGNVATRDVTVTAGVSIAGAASVPPRGSATFTASGGSGAGFTWSLVTNASDARIDASTGAYTAGAIPSVTDVLRVTDSLGNSASVAVAVTAGASILPEVVSVPPLGGQGFAAAGGSGVGFTWSMAVNLSGGSIDAATGAYRAGAIGSVTDIVEVRDSLGNSAWRNVTVTAAISISPAIAAVPPRGGQTFGAAGGSGSGWTWSLATNPSGGSIDASTGVYTAGPTPSVTDVVRVTDSLGNVALRNVSVTGGITIAPVVASVPPRGGRSFSASGGSGTGWVWSLATNASGGNINSLTGAYVAGQTPSVTDVVRVEDSLGNSAIRNVTVGPGVTISPVLAGQVPGGSLGFTASGGSGGGWTWSLATNESAAQPINSSTGAYVAGPLPGTDVVRVIDSLGNEATRSVTVSALSISPATATTTPRGSQVFTASGGSLGGYTWSLATNASGGSIGSSTGAYTAGATGNVTDVVRVTDSRGNVTTRSVTVTAGVSIAGAASVPPRGSGAFTASGGSGAGFTWSFATNRSQGSIDPATGAYTAGPTPSVVDVVQATDSLGNVGTRNVTVSAGVSITGPAGVPPRGSQAFGATGGSGAGFSWALATNASGGSVDAATGVYTAGPTPSVTDVLLVTDSLGNVGTRDVAVTAGVSIAGAATVPPRGSHAFTASGGSGSGFTWTLETNASGGSIQAGTGTYTAGPTPSVVDVVRAIDSLGNSATWAVGVTSGVAISPETVAVAPRGSHALSASGGSGSSFSWSLATNASGGSIHAATGVYTAGPTGGVTDVVQVIDSLGNVATRDVGVGAGVAIAPVTLAVPPRGGHTFTAAGGSGAGWIWDLATNASGGSVDAATGAYVAGPTGSVTDVVRVTDSLGNVGTREVTVTATISIAPPGPSIPPRGSQTFGAAGGSGGGWTWSLETNASGGTIDAGTGAYTAGPIPSVVDVVRVTDSLGNSATESVIVAAGPSILPGTAAVPPRGDQSFAAMGGSGAGFTWSVAVNLSGGGIDPSTGVYTAGPIGNVTDVVEVRDSLGNTAWRDVLVTAGVSITPAVASVPPRGARTFGAEGGSGAGWTWTLATNASGGSIDAATGVYTAGPTPSVVDVVRVTDSLGNVALRSVSVTAGVNISPANASLPPRGGRPFFASGGSNTGFSWSITTNLSGGSIDADTGVYVAGPTPSVTDVIRVEDSLGNSATRNVSVGPGPSISPAIAGQVPGGSLTFTASGGSGGGWSWSLATDASGGSIDPVAGVYVAGATGDVTDVVQVRDSLGNVSTRDVAVGVLSVSPATATMPPKGSQIFTAAGGSLVGYAWSLPTNASGGSIDAATGVYVAGPIGDVTDVVRVIDSRGNAATRSVEVTASVSVSPAAVVLPPRAGETFAAAGGSGAGFAWSLATNASGGSIDPATGAYAAGPTGAVTDVVQVADSLGNVATRVVAVTAGVSIAPADASVPPGGSQAFAAAGGSGEGYAWSLATNASGGSVDPATGAYAAGPTGGVTDVVRVTDSLGNVALRDIGVGPGVSIAPGTAGQVPTRSLAFSASGGSAGGWNWSLATNASGGTVDAATGVYVAGPTAGTDVVRVTDSLGNAATASILVSALAISPASMTTPPRGAPVVLAASGGSVVGYAWSFEANASGGSIDTSAGAYAPGATGGVTDVVRVTDAHGNVATREVTVTAGIAVSPASASVSPGGIERFAASGGSGTGFGWSLETNASGGSIDASTGAYTAGPTGGVTDVVRVTDALGNVMVASVTVVPPAGSSGGGGGCGTGGGEASLLALGLVVLLLRRAARRRRVAA